MILQDENKVFSHISMCESSLRISTSFSHSKQSKNDNWKRSQSENFSSVCIRILAIGTDRDEDRFEGHQGVFQKLKTNDSEVQGGREEIRMNKKKKRATESCVHEIYRMLIPSSFLVVSRGRGTFIHSGSHECFKVRLIMLFQPQGI